MQNLSNATTTRFNWIRYQKKSSKNVKKTFFPSLTPSTVLLKMAKDICVATGKIISSLLYFPPFAASHSRTWTFFSIPFLYPCVCCDVSEKEFSYEMGNFFLLSNHHHSKFCICIMKWYHWHCVKLNMLSGGNANKFYTHRWKWNISNNMKFYPLKNTRLHSHAQHPCDDDWLRDFFTFLRA